MWALNCSRSCAVLLTLSRRVGWWLTLLMAEGKEEHEADLKRREAAVAAREAALAERMETAQVILGAANERDANADAEMLPPTCARRTSIGPNSWPRKANTGTAVTGPNAATPLSTASTRRMIARHPMTIGWR